MSDHPKILLTSVTRPFGKRHGDAFTTQTRAMHQLMWAQDMFLIEDPSYHWGLDLIAYNIEAPTVVLHYPSLRELASELRRGHYDYVGISFNPPVFHKLKKMIPVIREAAPDTKIILGGHGTALRDDELAGLYDILCREEGVRFFRKFLGEPERAYKTPPFVFESSLFSLPLLGKTAPIFGAVGCANGCDFCMTSHYFKKQHLRFLETGQDVLNAILEVQRADPGCESFVIYDEDLLLNQTRGREFLEACRNTDARFTISVFASVKALSQYEPTELAEMGVNSAWIGFEGMKAGYAKQEGKSYEQLFKDLNSVGIGAAASMIVGFDYHTPEIIEREFSELLRLKPMVSQFLIYGPTRGSALYDRMASEKRLTEVADFMYPMMDGSSLGFHHPAISAPRMEAITKQLYRDEYEYLGPTIYRTIDVTLQGYRTLKNATEPRLKIRAQMQLEFLRHAFAAKRIGMVFAPNNLVQNRIEHLYEELEREIGKAPTFQEIQSVAVLPFGWLTRHKLKFDSLKQSPPLRHEYNMRASFRSWPRPGALVKKLAGKLLAPS